MNKRINPWIDIHIATLLFGVAGVFGKFIELPAEYIVFGRALFASATLLLFQRITGGSLQLNSKREGIIIIFLGLLLAFHWYAFFHAIQVSTVAIGLFSFASFPVFVTLLEPVVFKERHRLKDYLITVLAASGIYLIVADKGFNDAHIEGIVWGVCSGFVFAVISLLNRKYIRKYSGSTIACYQNGVAALVLLPICLFGTAVTITAIDWLSLIVLGVVFTAVAHTLFIRSMKSIKAQQASVVVSLEPVYGVLFAALLLSEVPALQTLIGGSLIVSAALWTARRNEPLKHPTMD